MRHVVRLVWEGEALWVSELGWTEIKEHATVFGTEEAARNFAVELTLRRSETDAVGELSVEPQ